MNNWFEHNNSIAKQHLGASEPLTLALSLFEEKTTNLEQTKKAADLGCGSGMDSIALIQSGWEVLAIDQDRTSLDRLFNEVSNNSMLTVLEGHFETLELPPLDLVNASFSLPFCHPDSFGTLWRTIELSIKSGGIFCGHLFGPEDSWAISRSDMTFHNQEQAQLLFNNFNIHVFKEIKKDGKTLTGHPKRWHIYTIVAIKR